MVPHGAYVSDNNHQDMGRSRGGLTSKSHVVVDGNGVPVHLALARGEAHDNRLGSVLLSALLPKGVVAVRLCSGPRSDRLRATLSPGRAQF
jgi:hypothetical protein